MQWHHLEAAPEYQPAWQELKELIGQLQEFERSPREHGQDRAAPDGAFP